MPQFECPVCGSESLSPSPTGRGLLCGDCNRQVSRKNAEVKTRTKAKRKTTRGRSDRQEKHTARNYGGRRTANSGAMDDKGDVKVKDQFRFEDKTTRGRSYVLKLEDLLKLARAAKGDEMPVLKVCFEDDLQRQYVIIPEPWFRQLIEEE